MHDDGDDAEALELIHEALPKVLRVMFLHDPEAAPNAFNLTQEAAPRLGMTMQAAHVHVIADEELLPELAIIAKERPEALLVYPDVVLSSAPPASATRRLRHQGRFAHDACIPFFRGCWRSHVLRRNHVRDLYDRGRAGCKDPGWGSAE